MDSFKSFVLLVLNILALALAMPVLEYDLNKLINPDYGWLPTNSVADILIISIVFILAIYHISVLFFVIIRKFYGHNKIIWFGTSVIWTLTGTMILILGKSFLPIYFPASF